MRSIKDSAINPKIKQYLREKGWDTWTSFQAQCIPKLRQHQGDFVGQSATGTGKTLSYGIPLIEQVDTSCGKIQAVVLVPTRELCTQVGKALQELSTYMEALKVEAVYGGIPLKKQKQLISHGLHILVATPGRLVDLIERRIVRLNELKIMVLDEADEMLLKGFKKDIDSILKETTRPYSSWLFSATLPQEIRQIINQHFTKNCLKLTTSQTNTIQKNIEHQAIVVQATEKQNVLFYFLNLYAEQQGIVFCRTRSGVQKLHRQLSKNKYKCGALNGDMPQGLRDKVMQQFRDGHIDLLIATDVASRGIDIPAVQFVIQYHPADSAILYTHRSGRTARKNEAGNCISFLFEEEQEKMEEIASALQLKLAYITTPDFETQAIHRVIMRARKIAREKPLADWIPAAHKQAFKKELQHLSKDELIEKLMADLLKQI